MFRTIDGQREQPVQYSVRRSLPVQCPLAVFLVSLVNPCWADLTVDLEAYEHHDYQTAVKKLRPLAEESNSSAQFLLGYMYTHGDGLDRRF